MAGSWLILCAALLPGAAPETSAATQPGKFSEKSTADKPKAAPSLRAQVHAALRDEATRQGADREAAVRQLARLHEAITADTKLSPSERLELRTLVRSRLTRVSDE